MHCGHARSDERARDVLISNLLREQSGHRAVGSDGQRERQRRPADAEALDRGLLGRIGHRNETGGGLVLPIGNALLQHLGHRAGGLVVFFIKEQKGVLTVGGSLVEDLRGLAGRVVGKRDRGGQAAEQKGGSERRRDGTFHGDTFRS